MASAYAGLVDGRKARGSQAVSAHADCIPTQTNAEQISREMLGGCLGKRSESPKWGDVKTSNPPVARVYCTFINRCKQAIALIENWPIRSMSDAAMLRQQPTLLISWTRPEVQCYLDGAC